MLNSVEQILPDRKMNISALLHQMKKSAFNARRVGISHQVLKDMVADKDCTRFLSLSGALIPAGMRSFLSEIISKKVFDVVVSTGANLTHDLIEVLGYQHIRINKRFNDSRLREEGKSRIYDATIEDRAFETLEDWIRKAISKAYEAEKLKNTVTTHILLQELGKALDNETSVLGAAAKANIPIFCPAITDSMLGLHIALLSQEIDLTMDPCSELQAILEIAFESKKTGALIVGGGVPKNYVLQAMLVSGRKLDYGIQITMDRPEHGGLSGASLDEAISWGKVDSKAQIVTVVADATIVLPLLLASFIDK
ncbi:MAG: deoxyhypusine synthase [Candidatus Hodarchaeales archaeon]|jgi:deoxyhypusine synthase